MRRQAYLTILVSVVTLVAAGAGCVSRTRKPQVNPDEVVVDKAEFLKLAKVRFDTRDSAMAASRFHSPIIQPGDQLTVAIYEKLPVSLERRIEMKRVNEFGTILLPPIGIIKVGGLAITEAAQEIEKAMKQFVVTPYCEIEVTQKGYQPQIYVFGEVGSSGAFPLRAGDRLLDALSGAGGCNSSAYRRSVKIVRQYGSKVGMISINLLDIMEQGAVSENLALQDQDVIYVPRRLYTTFHEVMSVLSAIVPWYFLLRNL